MLDHNYIGTEHVLLGLIHEGEGVAARAFDAMNISLEAVRQQVEEMSSDGGKRLPPPHPVHPARQESPRALAPRSAAARTQLHRHRAHPARLMPRGEGVAAQVLQKLGADLNRVRQIVIQLLSGYTRSTGGSPVEPEATGWNPTARSGPRCPSCGLRLEGKLRYQELIATHQDEGEDAMPILMLFCSSCGALLRSFRGTRSRMSPVGLSTPKRTDATAHVVVPIAQIRIEHERTDRRRHELHRLNVAAERPDRLARARPRSRPVLHEVVARVAADDRIDLCPVHADNDNPALDQSRRAFDAAVSRGLMR